MAIAAGASGQFVLAGWTKPPVGSGGLTPTADYLTIQFSPDGQLLWLRGLDGGGEEVPQDVALDSQGRIVVAGVSKSRTRADGYVAQYSAGGELLRTYRYETTPAAINAAAVDSQDHIILAGYVGPDIHIMKSRDGYVTSGEYLSPVRSFGQPVRITGFQARTALQGQRITATIELSRNNLLSVMESVPIELQEGDRAYSVQTRSAAPNVRVRLAFETSDPRRTPEFYQYAVRGVLQP
jgi:hypothetical protein